MYKEVGLHMIETCATCVFFLFKLLTSNNTCIVTVTV